MENLGLLVYISISLFVCSTYSYMYHLKLRSQRNGFLVAILGISISFLVAYYLLFGGDITSSSISSIVSGLILEGILWIIVPTRKRCINCHTINRTDARFCSNCGNNFEPIEKNLLIKIPVWRLPSKYRYPAQLAGIFFIGFIVSIFIQLPKNIASTTPTQLMPYNNINSTQAPTVTPIPLVRVVIAYQMIPRGYRFPNTVQELANIVGYATWPEISVPFNAIKEQDGGLEKVLGQFARADILRSQIILSNLLVTDIGSISRVNQNQPPPNLPKEGIEYDKTYSGEINDNNWIDNRTFVGNSGDTISFTMYADSGNLRPFLFIWNQDTGDVVEGQRFFEERSTSLTVTLPAKGIYLLSATRARANNGSTGGTYHLIAKRGYIIITPPA